MKNVRAISEFAGSRLAGTDYSLLPSVRLQMKHPSLLINIRPSLILGDSAGNARWTYCDFSEARTESRKCEFVLAIWLLGASQSGINLNPKHLTWRNFHSGEVFNCTRVTNSVERQVMAACETFSNIWTAI